jgi:hypothetical protein
VNHPLSPRRRPNRKVRQTTALRLETLEDRTLLSANPPTLFNPAAILRVDSGTGALGQQSPPAPPGGPAAPPQATYPNVLVNDPAEDGNSVHDTHSETSIAVFGTTVVSVYNDSLFLNNNPGQITGLSRSTDRGGTFTDTGRLPTIPGGDAGDPVLAHDNSSGRSYLATLSFSNGNTIPLFRSDDGFATYLPGSVNAAPGRFSLDKEWLTVDNFSGPGQGNVYLVVRDFGSGNGIFLTRSTDQGNSFGPNGGVAIATGSSVQGAWVAVGPDHAVYAFWYETGRIGMRKSTDQGQTFGPAVTVTTLQTNGVNGDLGLGGFRSNAFPQAVVNPVNGQVYVAYDDKGAGSDRADVYFRQSNDGGATWSSAVRVVDDTTGRDQWQPALAVTPNGSKVGVFWYDRRNDPANNLIDRYGAIGTVAGDTVAFGPNFRITDTSFPPTFGHDPGIVPSYMGDYDQAVGSNDGFYLNWGDNRLPSLSHAGNRADVRFARIPVDVAGPSVIAVSPAGRTFAPISTLRVTFDEPIDPTTATPDQFVIQDPAGNLINVNAVTPVDGSGGQQFDVAIDQQTVVGTYSVSIGPFIADTAGHFMDQDGDGNPVGDVDDGFSGSFAIQGSRVTASTPTGSNNAPGTVDHVRLTFNEPMDPNSFTTDQVMSFTDPNGNQVPVSGVQAVAGSNNTQFDVQFAPLTLSGSYSMVVGPNVLDAFGNPMDQDDDLVTGQTPDDQYVAQFALASPAVLSTTLTGSFNDQVDHGRLVFNLPIDPNSFTPDQFVLLDPSGNPVNVTGITPVDGTNNTQWDVTFDPQTALGTYNLTVGPNITDAFGNPAALFHSQFRLTAERLINGGFETGDFTGWTQSGNTGATGVGTGTVHSGMFSAFLGPVGSDGFIAQSFATIPGVTYVLDYWLQHDGGSPSDFYALIDGVTVPGSRLDNPPAFGYTEYTFTFTATGTTTELKFGFREDPTYFHLDDVSVSPSGPVPPGGAGHAGLVSASLAPGQARVGGGVLDLPAGASGAGTRLLREQADSLAALPLPGLGGSLVGAGGTGQALSGSDGAAPLAYKGLSAAQRPGPQGTEALDGLFARLGEERAPL